MAPSDEHVLVEHHDGWALITLNRPEKRNAMNRPAQQRLREVLAQVNDKKVVVVTGVGSSFCSGVDLTEKQAAAGSERQTSANIGYWAEPTKTSQSTLRYLSQR